MSEERTLRGRSTQNKGLWADETSHLRTVEVQLDQCRDLLRQRRALSEFGDDPNAVRVRPADEAEGYRS
ncbi:DUF2630 family protein [Streptomyces sp. NPDC056352]|uniref:DUF2630 family protein n=1 Tax=Streptomyces sp. NPDC056352 TaxID=3345791 RepID=UPI0035E1D473